MDSQVTPLDQIKECINSGNSFVLQGGAGSGKTETLKMVLEYIGKNYPEKIVACITHTNLAVDEIKSRVEGNYTISTIHSFLNFLIKDYKKNIHSVIYEIFKLENVTPSDPALHETEAEQKTADHNNYKKLHAKYGALLFTLRKEKVEKPEGKRNYDKDPSAYNKALNEKIDDLNKEIKKLIDEKNYNTIEYNESRFDEFENLTFGHDSLIILSYHLFQKYEVLGRILQDKFDFIFVDEYQDTHPKIIEILLKLLPARKKSTIGLFGDSMQSIYDDGIGDVEKYVADGALQKIIKEDNYRCSQQVIDFINGLRNDGLKQAVALKIKDGKPEEIKTREGTVKFLYSLYETKPTAFAQPEHKEKYLITLNTIIKDIADKNPGYKKLMLTNKSIAGEVGFQNLYEVFDARYIDAKEYIEKDLAKMQLTDLVALCSAYSKEPKNYNLILSELKKSGFALKKIEDKKKIKEHFDFLNNSNESAVKALEYSFENKLLKISEKYINFLERKDAFLTELKGNAEFQEFKVLFAEGYDTASRIIEKKPGMSEEEFKELHRILRKETFYHELFSNKIKFQELLRYYEYLNEDSPYITMHKTKGSGIENVLVVLDEYFWGLYNFSTIFDPAADIEKKNKNLKLIYVACSRAKTNLICIKLIKQVEEASIKALFPAAEKIELPQS